MANPADSNTSRAVETHSFRHLVFAVARIFVDKFFCDSNLIIDRSIYLSFRARDHSVKRSWFSSENVVLSMPDELAFTSSLTTCAVHFRDLGWLECSNVGCSNSYPYHLDRYKLVYFYRLHSYQFSFFNEACVGPESLLVAHCDFFSHPFFDCDRWNPCCCQSWIKDLQFSYPFRLIASCFLFKLEVI